MVVCCSIYSILIRFIDFKSKKYPDLIGATIKNLFGGFRGRGQGEPGDGS